MAAKKRVAKKRPAAKKVTKKATKKAAPKTARAKKAVDKPAAPPRMTTVERFVSGKFTAADLAPVPVKCPECGHLGVQATKGRFGPVWRCLNRPACKHYFDSRPTGKKCGYVTAGEKCGALMVEGTKTIPDRCSLRSCPNRNPHKL